MLRLSGYYIEGIVVHSSAARDYILAAVPSPGAAQEARYPAGTLGDIQAVTACQVQLDLKLNPACGARRRIADTTARVRADHISGVSEA